MDRSWIAHGYGGWHAHWLVVPRPILKNARSSFEDVGSEIYRLLEVCEQKMPFFETKWCKTRIFTNTLQEKALIGVINPPLALANCALSKKIGLLQLGWSNESSQPFRFSMSILETQEVRMYHLKTKMTLENHHVLWEIHLQMVGIFHCHLSFRGCTKSAAWKTTDLLA